MSLQHAPARQEREAFTVDEFCQAHRISRSALYGLWRAGIGPRVIKVGPKNIITKKAAAEWRAAREAASPQHGALEAFPA
jgi:hypothetical protein